jgi:hypothetical protein
MHTLTITVQRGSGSAWPVVAEVSAPGDFLPMRSESVLRFPDIAVGPDANLDPEHVREHFTALALDPRAYGATLGRALFADTLRDAFAKALTRSGGALHVLLFVEDPELRSLRWERVCGPIDDRWVFLALDQRVPFSLYLPAVTDRRFRPIGRRDLRALVVVAAPTDVETKYRLPPFDAPAAVAGVRRALGDIPCTVLASTPGADGPPTLEALCERLTAEAYSLLHLVCHGRYLRTEQQTVLYLASVDGTTAPVTDAQLIGRLSGLTGARGLPHFAFLCACESASPEAVDGAGGLAHRLVRELGMPAVLAMTEPVTVGTGMSLAERFYVRLREHGYPDLALAESWAGLASRPDVHVPALFGRLGGRPLFTDDIGDRSLTAAEIDRGLTRAVALLADRSPVLLSRFRDHEATLRRTLETPIESLPFADRQAREGALTELGALCQEALEVSFAGLALEHKEPTYDARCPFRGLYPFRAVDQEFFFGREALVEHLYGKLLEHSFLAVLGPSGSGKSSVVMAGLLPRLVRDRTTFKFLYLTAGGEPDTFLDAVLTQTPSADLLLVDQFEELFTMCTDPGRRRAFVDRLLGAASRMMIVITMRADFWGECASYPALKDRMQAHQELVGPMTASELRSAIDKQAGSVGLRFEADLSQVLVDEVAEEPGAMPLLQHALQEVWKRRHGRWLMASEYRAVGGVKKAIAETAEGVYRDLSDADRERMRDIFVRLTRLGDDAADGGERRDTRQRVRLAELVPAQVPPDDTKRLVKRLADEGARLLVSGVQRGEETVEVAHEALIRYWPRLRDWLDEDRTDLHLLAGVRAAAAEWDKNRTEDGLLRGARLVGAERLKEHPRIVLNQLEAEYLAACIGLREREQREKEERAQQALEQALALAESQRRRVRVFRTASVVVGVLFLFAGAAALVAYHQRNEAQTKKKEAEDAKDEAEQSLAAGIWRPIGLRDGPPNASEFSALTELGSLPPTQRGARARVLKLATSSPGHLNRFVIRTGPVVQAAIGLDRELAGEFQNDLQRLLEDPNPNVQLAAALGLAELELIDRDRAERAARAVPLEIVRDRLVGFRRARLWALIALARSLGYEPVVGDAVRRAAETDLSLIVRFGLPRQLVEMSEGAPNEFRIKCLELAVELLLKDVAASSGRTGAPLREFAPELTVWVKGLGADRAAQVLKGALEYENDPLTLRTLATGLVEVTGGLREADRALYLTFAAEKLRNKLAEYPKVYKMQSVRYSATGLARVVAALPQERTEDLARAAKALAGALETADKDYGRTLQEVPQDLGEALVEVVGLLPETDRNELLEAVAKNLSEAIGNLPDSVHDPREPYRARSLGAGLGAVAHGLPVEKRVPYLRLAAEKMRNDLPGAVFPMLQEQLAVGLAAVVRELPEAARREYLAPAAEVLVGSMKTNQSGMEAPSTGLAAVVDALPEGAGTKYLVSAAERLTELLPKTPEANRTDVAMGLAAVTKGLRESDRAPYLRAAADVIAAALAKAPHRGNHKPAVAQLAAVTRGLPAVERAKYLEPALDLMLDNLAEDSQSQFGKDYLELVPTVTQLVEPVVAGRALFRAIAYNADRPDALLRALRDLTKPLGPNDLPVLVELLKLPFCYGEGRDIVVRRLAAVTGQTFRTRWDAVEYLRTHHPEIDLTAPPPLPERYRDDKG